MDDVTIRPATQVDLDAVIAFGTAVVPAHYEPIVGREMAWGQVEQWWTREGLGAAIDNGDLLLAESDGAVVGVTERGRFESDPVIWKLYVHPDLRGRGIGRALLRAAIDGLPGDAPRVLIEHFAGNERAGHLYEREGFRHLRTDPAANGDPAAATVWRVRDLQVGSRS